MNRRDLLLASSGILACAASGSALGMSSGLLGASPDAAARNSRCALIPMQPAMGPMAESREICVQRFYPSEVEGPGQLEHLSLDLQLLDERFQLHTIYAWQLARRSCASCSGNFRMALSGQLSSLIVHLRQRGARVTESWSARPLIGFDSVLVTARSSTGRVPGAAELRLDTVTRALSLADGSPRDFDAVLLSAT